MIQKHFFATFIAYLMISFQPYATDLEATKDPTESCSNKPYIYSDAWIYIASNLKDEKTVVHLGRVCKQAYHATQNLHSWEGVAQKYQIQPRQVHRYLELLSQYKEKDEIDLGLYGRFSTSEEGVFSTFVKAYSYTKDVPLIAAPLTHLYISVKDYVRVKIEDEEQKKFYRENYERYTILKPMKISSNFKLFDLDNLIIIQTEKLPEQK